MDGEEQRDATNRKDVDFRCYHEKQRDVVIQR